MRQNKANQNQTITSLKVRGWFGAWLTTSLLFYLSLIILLIVADVWYVLAKYLQNPKSFQDLLDWSNLWESVKLTFLSCTISTILSLLIAISVGYLLSRFHFRGKSVIDAIIDIPIILPPLVIGLSLLILFNNFPPQLLEWQLGSIDNYLKKIGIRVTNTKLAIIVAQFTISAAFTIRMMKSTFDQIDTRIEQIAMTLGASRGRAFFDVILPQSYRGVTAAGTLAWARSLGEFGPIIVFAGATRGKTEVLSTSVYLEINTGNLHGAVIISILMIALALLAILLVRYFTEKGIMYGSSR